VAAFVLLPRGGEVPSAFDDAPVFRGTAATLGVETPVGSLDASPTTFRWRSNPDAAYYRFELLDLTATPLVQTVTRDTVIVATATSPVPMSLEAGLWKVTAIDDAGLELEASSMTRFEVSSADTTP